MPWTARTIKKHNKALTGAKAKKAAAIADSVLAKTGDEGKALRIANGVVKKDAAHKLYPKNP